jgi:type IV pilus modification protein PilV
MRANRKHPKLAYRREAGFSLVEIMVAMTFLAIGLLAIAQLIPTGLKGVTEARVRTNAVQNTQRIIDDLRAADYDSLDAGTFSETDGRYSTTWTITDDSPTPNSKRVDVVSTWGPNQNPRTVSMSTYLTRNH